MAAIFVLLLIFAGCKKKGDGIGADLLPEDVLLGLSRIDTLSISSFTLLDDSIRVDNEPTVMLGQYNDPKFGKVTAGFFTQLRLSTNEPVFTTPSSNNVIAVDSVVLALIYTDEQYGFNFPQEYEVYEINERLYLDSVYYSNREIPLKSTDLVLPESRNQRPNPSQSVIVGADSSASPQLRLRLDHAFAQRIIDAEESDSLDTDIFGDFMKGLYVTVADKYIPPGNGGVHYFNLLAANSKLTIYYSELQQDTVVNVASYDLLINSNAQFFSKTTHDFSQGIPDITAQLNGNGMLGQQNVYLRAGAGLKTRLQFPHLNELNSDSMIINRAELIFPIEMNTTFPPPSRLFAIGRTADNSAYLLPDLLEGDSHFNGFLDPLSQTYKMNISRWVQQIVFGSRENDNLEIVSNRAASTVNRVVLYGPDHPDKQMKLVLHYTKF